MMGLAFSMEKTIAQYYESVKQNNKEELGE
jgi:hypothetical protein